MSRGERRLRALRQAAFVFAQALVLYGVWRLATWVPEPRQGPLAHHEVVADLRSRQLLVPVAGVERSALRGSFGDPRGARKHLGIDILAPRHRPILAVEAGTVARLSAGKLSGRALHLLSSDRLYAYFYAHLESYAAGLREGRRVRSGDILGYVGSSGNAQVPHLHFTIRRLATPGLLQGGLPIDPFDILGPQ